MRSMTSFVEIFWIFAPKPSYTRIQSLFLIFKLVSKSPFLSSDVRVVLRPSPKLIAATVQWNTFRTVFQKLK